jgi:hypothetical protein
MDEDHPDDIAKESGGRGGARECPCAEDPFDSLPPELRPTQGWNRSGLRQVTCPGCGKVYWTNRALDLCIDCD